VARLRSSMFPKGWRYVNETFLLPR
jgi:hypothetical protein